MKASQVHRQKYKQRRAPRPNSLPCHGCQKLQLQTSVLQDEHLLDLEEETSPKSRSVMTSTTPRQVTFFTIAVKLMVVNNRLYRASPRFYAGVAFSVFQLDVAAIS